MACFNATGTDADDSDSLIYPAICAEIAKHENLLFYGIIMLRAIKCTLRLTCQLILINWFLYLHVLIVH